MYVCLSKVLTRWLLHELHYTLTIRTPCHQAASIAEAAMQLRSEKDVYWVAQPHP